MQNAIGLARASLEAYTKNMPSLVWATFIYLVSVSVILGAATSLLLIIFYGMAAVEIPPGIFMPALAVSCAGILLLAFFILSGLKCGYFQMCHIASRGGSASLLGFLEYSWRKALPAFLIEGFQLLVLLIALFIGLAISILISASGILFFLILLAFGSAAMLANLVFSLALPSLIMDGTNAINSAKRSTYLVSQSRFRFYLICAICLLAGFISFLVPFFGPLLLIFFGMPLFVISMFSIYSQVRTI